MKKFKILYWFNGYKLSQEINAEDATQARYYFEMCLPNDGVISVEEVKADV